jgi:AcrR family transcriptional regulator
VSSAQSNGRIERSKKAVLTATFRLMSEEGLSGVTVDTVSKRSGVAKTTIYRHWPSRGALLLEACSKLGENAAAGRPGLLPDTGSLKDDATVLALDFARRLRTAKWASVLPSIVDAAERDSEIARLHLDMHALFMAGFRKVIERAELRGQLPPGLTQADVLAAIVGPLFYRRWFTREPLDERFARQVVANAVGSKA